MAIPDWKVKLHRACYQAGKVVWPPQFKAVQRGLIMSRRKAWENENPIPLAFWPGNIALVVLDGGVKRRGTLMLIQNQIAYEVETTPEILQQVYAPHHIARWWQRQTQHSCAPVAAA